MGFLGVLFEVDGMGKIKLAINKKVKMTSQFLDMTSSLNFFSCKVCFVTGLNFMSISSLVLE